MFELCVKSPINKGVSKTHMNPYKPIWFHVVPYEPKTHMYYDK